jgi:predicted oxidoreductase
MVRGEIGIFDRVAEVAAARGIPRAQVELAWLLSKPVITAPIVGATKYGSGPHFRSVDRAEAARGHMRLAAWRSLFHVDIADTRIFRVEELLVDQKLGNFAELT